MNIGCISYKMNEPQEFANSGPRSHYLINKFREILAAYMYESEHITFVTGLNPGPDLLFGLLAIEEELPLTAYISHIDMPASWGIPHEAVYGDIIKYKNIEQIHISKLERVAHEYKNDQIINSSDVIIIVKNEDRRSNYYISKALILAKSLKKDLIIIENPEILKECSPIY